MYYSTCALYEAKLFLRVLFAMPVFESITNKKEQIYFILRHILKNMKAKSYSQMERFFITRCLQIAFTLNTNIGYFGIS